MSGIAGAYFLDGRHVDGTLIQRMLRTFECRGPDGTNIWTAGHVAFGHAMLRSTPESLSEQVPLNDDARSLAITADARIDNRSELLRTLDVGTDGPDRVSDSQIILAAYRRWGTACVERLTGDFSFAIWDRDAQALFCARDQVGVRPFFYWHQPDLGFVFASEIKALFETPLVPRHINDTRVGDYLLSIQPEPEATFFAHVWRLPAGHCMTVDRTARKIQSYWQPDTSRTLRLGSDAAYAEAFHAVFREAVECRLRSAAPPGAMLSGGLDSSAVVAVAHRLLEGSGRTLWTFSTVFEPDNPCNESPYIEAVLGGGAHKPHNVPFDHERHRPIGDLKEALRRHDEPVFRPNAAQSWQLYAAIHASGCRVVLDGHGGDEVVSHGSEILKQLARERRWIRLANELRWLVAGENESYIRLLTLYVTYGLVPVFNSSAPLRLTRRLWRAARKRIGGHSVGSFSSADLIASDFAREFDAASRRRAHGRLSDSGSEREAHYNSLTAPLQAAGLESLNMTASTFSTEVRFPFWDRRLVEFCLTLPPEQKLNRGWGRMVLRRSMEGILPRDVQWRRHKTDFFPNAAEGLRRNDQRELEMLKGAAPRLDRFIDVPGFRAVCDRLQSSEPVVEDYLAVVRVASLYNWMESGLGRIVSR